MGIPHGLRNQPDVDISDCKTCELHSGEMLFDTCFHLKSRYLIGSKLHHHTCQHMRAAYGQCGPSAALKRKRS